MDIRIYLRKGTVYMPTSRQVPGSFLKHTEPVQVARASDIVDVISAFDRAIAVGNPLISHEEALAAPTWVTKAITGVSSRRAFEQGVVSWSLSTHPKTGEYRMFPFDAMKGGGWTRNDVPVFTLPATTSISETVRRASEVVCHAAKCQAET